MPDRAPARSFQDLIVWQKAHNLVLAVYRITSSFPRSELFGLVSQMRRAAVSIPANIAEGFGKSSQADKGRFLNFSQGSLEELRYYLILANDLEYSDTSGLKEHAVEVGKLLNGYKNAIRRSCS